MEKYIESKTAHSLSDNLFRDAEIKEDKGDLKGAFESLLAAARMGHVLSQIGVGNYYAGGKGVDKDFQEAAHWYRLAYKNGQPAGAINLAVDLQRQGNTRGAIAWLKRAVAMGDGEASVQLAKIYLEKPRSTKAAIALLKQAVSLGPGSISEETREDAGKMLDVVL